MEPDVIVFSSGGTEFSLNLRAHQLQTKDGRVVQIEPTPLRLLETLLKEPRRVFSLKDLQERVWDGSHVAPDAVSHAMGKVRHAIGDDNHAVIVTVARSGYRLDTIVKYQSNTASLVKADPDVCQPAQHIDDPFRGRVQHVESIFRPDPVRDVRRLVGRSFELAVARRHLRMRGQHVLFSGPMGVGKTSLALTLAESFARESQARWHSVEVNEMDSFAGIVRKLRISINPGAAASADGFRLTPFELALELIAAAGNEPLVIVLDEFQRRMKRETAVGIAELLKALSNRSARVQFVIVGTADNIEDLVNAHESLALRHLLAVRVDLMSQPTAMEIVLRGFNDMTNACGWPRVEAPIDELIPIANSIAALSLGLPSIVTGLARETSFAALDNRAGRVTETDFKNGLLRLTAQYARSFPQFDLRQLARDQYLIACAASRGDLRGFRTLKGASEATRTISGATVRPGDITDGLAEHFASGVLERGRDDEDLRFVLNLLPSRLLVAAVAEQVISVQQLAGLWRSNVDQGLDELDAAVSECAHAIDLGIDTAARELHRQVEALLASLEELVAGSSYPSQRERLAVLERRKRDLDMMLNMGEAPTVG